jgi:hypothetical protein
VRLVVAQAAYLQVLKSEDNGIDVLGRISASYYELAKRNLDTIRRQQALVGVRSRMAKQMALYLKTMSENDDAFRAILEKTIKAETSNDDDVPVIWTEQGLILNLRKGMKVMVDWDDVVGVSAEDDGFEGEKSPDVNTVDTPEWRWRVADGNGLEPIRGGSGEAVNLGANDGFPEVQNPFLLD